MSAVAAVLSKHVIAAPPPPSRRPGLRLVACLPESSKAKTELVGCLAAGLLRGAAWLLPPSAVHPLPDRSLLAQPASPAAMCVCAWLLVLEAAERACLGGLFSHSFAATEDLWRELAISSMGGLLHLTHNQVVCTSLRGSPSLSRNHRSAPLYRKATSSCVVLAKSSALTSHSI
jgi:hypothetical protein